MTHAFILSAGLGTRLRPLTNMLPKPLLPVWGRPAVSHIFSHLRYYEIKDVIINIHHLAHKVKTVLGSGKDFGVNIKYSYEPSLLDTGGGLKKVEYFLKKDTFIIYNCDVITNVNLKKMIEFHKDNRNYVTLLASQVHNPKALRVGHKGRVLDISHKATKNGWTFCGIHIIEPFIFDFIPKDKRISIIETYLRLIREGIPVNTFPLGRAFWREIGNMDSYNAINLMPHCDFYR